MHSKKRKLVLDSNQNTAHWDDTFKLMSWWDEKKVQDAKIMVVGAGALGNEVLKNLALMNVGNIFVVDFDIIEYSNLCRSVLFRESDVNQKSSKAEVATNRIKEINPNVNVQYVNGDIMLDVGLGVFRRMDAIIGCLDNRIARLFINRYSFMVGKTWIDGAIENISGQLTVYRYPHSCYECRLTEHDWINIRAKMGCADIAQRNSAAGRVPTTPISSSIIGAMQVQEALKVVHGYDQNLMLGDHFKYDGMNNWVLNYGVEELNEDCDSHYVIDEAELILCEEIGTHSSLADTLKILSKTLDTPNPIITLNYKIITEITTMESEISHEILCPEPHFTEMEQQKYVQNPGEQIGITGYVSHLDRTFPNLEVPLKALGIAPLHILTVETEKDIYFVELTKDADYLNFQ